MIIITHFPLQADLLPLTKALWAKGIAHQVLEWQDQQQLWLVDIDRQAEAITLCQQFVDGQLSAATSPADVSLAQQTSATSIKRLVAQLLRVPVTSGVIFLAVIIGLPTVLGDNFEIVAPLSFFYIEWLPTFHLVAGFDHLFSEPWRLLTPVWLHFGWAHLLFNCLWCWELGRRIEVHQSGRHLLLIFVITGIAGNLAQAWQGVSLFGGLSGVNYGLLGYIWWWDQFYRPLFRLPQGIVLFMLIFLALGFTDVFAFIGLGNIANMAHLGGLLAGVVLAVILSMLESRRRS